MKKQKVSKKCKLCGGAFLVHPCREGSASFCSVVCNGQAKKVPVADRFNKKVIKKRGCWSWKGATAHFGYGSMNVNGKMDRAHRISWVLHNGPIPKGMLVLHKCDNPPCANPKHLYLGTQSDNIKDAYKRNRKSQEGVKNNSAKLNSEKVMAIRELYGSGGKLQKDLALMFGVNQQCISLVVNNKRWI